MLGPYPFQLYASMNTRESLNFMVAKFTADYQNL